ncbi:MAG: tyrosine-type recombinase/integrase [Phycisphaera sp. RhM]|nr:tyrosine-type recombinase/integrase [Phycisphaera sp. RhM]
MPVRKLKTGYQIRFQHEGSRIEIYVPQVTKDAAQKIESRVRRLAVVRAADLTMDADDAKWLAGISDNLHAKLVANEIVPERTKQTEAAGQKPNWRRAADDYMEQYHAKPGTVEQMKLSHKSFEAYLQHRERDVEPIESLDKTDATGFRAHLLKAGKAEATVRKQCSRVKQVFTWACQRKIVNTNPFDEVRTGAVANTEFQRPVPAKTVNNIIDKLECPDAKMILALCRFGGFRYHETALTEWDDIDLITGWMTVRSSKTETRRCPLFSKLRPYLEAVPADQRSGPLQKRWPHDANARTTLKKMIKATGHEPWGKITHILRKSRATELLAHVPAHEVAKWLGHSLAVLQKWYALQSDENAKKAIATL